MSLVYWKPIINLKEIKKHSGTFFLVWAKNQLRFENVEKFLKFAYKNLNGDFKTHFLSHLPGP